MKYFDAHTHLNIQFDNDWKESGERSISAGVGFVNVGADIPRSVLAVEQAEYFSDNGYATVGIHPTDSKPTDEEFEAIRNLARNPKVVAIGECGLEYFRIEDQAEKDRQKDFFIKHIELALEVGKQLMIHCRPSQDKLDAYEDALVILQEYKEKVGDKLKFDMHFFAGDWTIAEKVLALDGYLSFTGVITFADQYDEVIKKMPLDRIMSETDAPFVAPKPFRGKRNEPAYVQYVAERIAELRCEPREVVLEALVENAKRFYSI